MKRTIKAALAALLAALLLCACASRPTITVPAWQQQYSLGVRYLSEGNYEEAIIAFTAAIEINPRLAEAYRYRGDAYILSGETAENLAAAQADYLEAAELDASLTEAWLGLADTQIRQGAFDDALESLRAAADSAPGDQTAADKLSQAEEGRFTDSSGEDRRVPVYGEDGEIAEYVYVRRVEAADEAELLAAVETGEPMIIQLEGRDYMVGCLWLYEHPYLVLQGTEGTQLLSADGEDTILYAADCGYVGLRNITMGHALGEEPMSCMAGVLYLYNSDADLQSCDLFGCGLQGLAAYECTVTARDSVIRDCSMNILEASRATLTFENCAFTGNGYQYPMDTALLLGMEAELTFTGCSFENNKNPGFYYDDPDSGSTVTLEDCTAANNAWGRM